MNKILFAVHGYEPPDWVNQVVTALPLAGTTQVRILVVLDAPSPPFTSLMPGARRRYDGARAEWQRLAHARVQSSVAALDAVLPVSPEVERVVATAADLGRAIVDHARRWGADLVVVGRDTRGRIGRVFRAAHEHVVDDAPCAVFVTPAAPPSAPDPIHPGRSRFGRRWPAAMRGA